jgi:hypothetical protein
MSLALKGLSLWYSRPMASFVISAFNDWMGLFFPSLAMAALSRSSAAGRYLMILPALFLIYECSAAKVPARFQVFVHSGVAPEKRPDILTCPFLIDLDPVLLHHRGMDCRYPGSGAHKLLLADTI